MDAFSDSNELINFLTTLAVSRRWVFRGYSLQEQLLPNIIRKNAVDIEIDLLKEFEKYGSQYFVANNPIDFMSTAQHFGLSTRLLDFTYNPFIALYFALFVPKGTNTKIQEDKEYYYIRYCNIDEQICLNQLPVVIMSNSTKSSSMTKSSVGVILSLKKIISELDSKESESYFLNTYWDNNPTEYYTSGEDNNRYVEEIKNKFRAKKLLFLDSNQCNQRIIMQQGLFLFPYTLAENEHVELICNNTKELRVHKDIRKELLMYLDTIGINAFRLMPDISSVCGAVERKVKENRRQRKPG